MESKIVKREGNTLQLQVKFPNAQGEASKNRGVLIYDSSQFICSTVAVQIRIKCYKTHEQIDKRLQILNNFDYTIVSTSTTNSISLDYTICIRHLVFVKFSKTLNDDNSSYSCEVESLQESCSFVFSNDPTWHYINSKRFTSGSSEVPLYEVKVKIDVVSGNGAFASLYDDSDLTDFKLCGIGGSVPVHSVILAGISPVLKTMFSGEWKEVAEGKINVSDTTNETLEHFKEYIYLDKLPEEGIKPLLLLASFYMIPDLVTKCIVKLLGTLNNENVVELIELAGKYNITNLVVAILNIVENGGLEFQNKLAKI